jgi:hypothetical protein
MAKDDDTFVALVAAAATLLSLAALLGLVLLRPWCARLTAGIDFDTEARIARRHGFTRTSGQRH